MLDPIHDFKREVAQADITSLILDIISNFKSPYFSAKKIRFDLYSKHGLDLRGRPNYNTNICNDPHFKIFLSSRIGHVTRKLKNEGYIQKFNRNTWKKIREINKNDKNLYLDA